MGSIPKGISASRAAPVVGLSSWNTPLDIWLEIQEERREGFCKEHGYDPPEREDTAFTLWGKAFENEIVQLAQKARGHWIEGLEEYHEFGPNITCHIDGRYNKSKDLHEGKTTNEFTFRNKWGDPGSNRIPSEYQIQAQHQLMCTRYERCIVSVLVFPKIVTDWTEAGIEVSEMLAAEWAPILYEMGYFHQYIIERSESLMDKLLEKYRYFWETYIIGETEPPPKTEEDIKRLCPEPKGTIKATAGIERLAAEYKGINAEMNRTKKRKEQIRLMLLKYMNNQADPPVDEDSTDKWRLVSRDGRKLFWFDGKTFR